MNIALAIFITPSELGLVVFTIPFVTFVSMFADFGMGSALVATDKLSRVQAGAALSLTVCLGLSCAALMVLAAAPVAGLAHLPGLTGVMVAMSAVVVLVGIGATPRALLERQLQYGRIATVEAIAVLVSCVVGLAAAWRGAGVWSLVMANLSQHVIRAAGFAWLARAGLQPNRQWRTLTPLISFGGWAAAGDVLNFFARNGDNLLIGAMLGSAALGVYGLAYQFMLAPLTAITWPISSVLFATLSRRRLPTADVSRAIEGVIAATSMLSFPAMIFLTFALAVPERLFLSGRWSEVPEILRWLAPIGALQSISSYTGAVLYASGRARAQFWLTAFNSVAMLGTFVIALPFGLHAFVAAYAASASALSALAILVMVSSSALTWTGLARSLTPALLASGGGLAAVAATGGLQPSDPRQWLMAVFAYGATVLAVYGLTLRSIRLSLTGLKLRPQL